MGKTALKVTDLRVRYGQNTVVDGVEFELVAGESLGLLGSNGAGKTSTIRALLGMLPHGGNAQIFGEVRPGWKMFRRIGFAPEEALPPDYLSGSEYLRFVSEFRIKDGKKRKEEVDRWIQLFDLHPSKKIRDYSKGMKRKIVLAQAFIGQPELLILDEPLNGLDPLMIMKLRDVITDYRKNGGTVLYSSHILSEVEKSCTQILILRKGVSVLNQPIPTVIKEYGNVETAFARMASEGVGNV